MFGRRLLVVATVVAIVLVVPARSQALHLGSSATPVSRTLQAATPPQPAGVPADAQEVAALRTRVSDTYVVPKSRQYLTVAYPYSVNYRDASGAWQPVDNTLLASSTSGYALANHANRYGLQLPGDLGSSPVRVDIGGQSIAFSLVGAHGAPTATGATASYSNALPGVSVSYRAENDAVKESVTLANASSPSALVYSLQVSAGLTPQALKSGEVDFTDASGKIVAAFSPPFMRDAAGAVSHDVSVGLAQAGSGWTLTETASAAWLSAASRKFPVVVDPSIVFYANDLPTDVDCTISTASPDAPLCGGQTLDVGYDGANASRALLQFHPELALPNNAQVLNAELHMYLVSATGSGASTVDAQQLTEAWSSWASWNHRDFFNTWSTAGGTFAASAAASQSVGTSPGWVSFYPTALAAGWLHKSTPDDGLLLKARDETASGVLHFASAENLNSTLAPYLTIRWQAWLGQQDWFTLSGMGLTDRMGLHVNLATGNLMIEATDLHLAGIAGQDLTISRWFNNLSGITGDLGNNWLSTVGRDVGISTFPDGSVVLYMPSGTQLLFLKKDDQGNFSSPPGINADLTKNLSTGVYILSFHDDGSVWTYDASGRLSSQKDRNGNTISYAYDPANGSLSSITDSRGQTTNVAYGADGYISQITDPSGRTYQYRRAANPNIPNLAAYIDPAGNETDFTYAHPHAQWDLMDITTAEGNDISMTYDASSRVTTIMRKGPGEQSGPTWTFTYATSDGRCPSGTVSVVSVTDPNTNTTTYCSDGLARVTKTIDPLGRTATTVWNDNNDVTSQTNPAGGTSNYTYSTDGLHNLQKTEGPANPQGLRQTETTGYSDTNHPFYPTAYHDPQNHAWKFAYDSAGNQIEKSEGEDAAGQNPVKSDFNTDGTVAGILDAKNTNACTDSKGNSATVCYAYSAHNPTEIDYPSPLGSFHFTWDNLNRLKTITDGRNQTTTYDYDVLDRLKTITYNDGSTVTYTYDKDGNLKSEADGTAVTAYDYDGLDRLKTETKPDGTVITYDYDAGGRLHTITENSQTTTYGYDAGDRLTSIQEPGVPAAIGISYPDETHSTITYPGGASVTSTYDNAYRLISIVNKNTAGSPVASYSYSYTWTDANNVTHDGSQRTSVTAIDGTTNYGYDGVGRLALAQGPDGVFQYAYDTNGNMCAKYTGSAVQTSFGCGSSGSGVASYTVNGANELTSPWSYDANGNLNSMPGLTFTYDPREQTSSITPSGQSALSASYFGPGQFQRTQFGGNTYLNDSLGIGRWTSGSTTTDFTRNPGGTELSESVGGNRYYYAFDGLGSVVGLFDSSGGLVSSYVQRYEPYGKPINGAPGGYPAMPIKFAGYWYDGQTGLYKVGARYYDPASGRWTQRDPMDNPYDLHGWNRYIYAGDDPANATDPSGLSTGGAGGTNSISSMCQNGIVVELYGTRKHPWHICKPASFDPIGGCAKALIDPRSLAAGIPGHLQAKLAEKTALASLQRVGQLAGRAWWVFDAATCIYGAARSG